MEKGFEVGFDFRIEDSASCGAFVHGLEDEFQEVRIAAIGTQSLHLLFRSKCFMLDSITELSKNSYAFAAKSYDFLIGMKEGQNFAFCSY